MRIVDCTVNATGGNGIAVLHCDGALTGNTITGSGDNGLYCVDNAELLIAATRSAIPAMAACVSGRASSATTASIVTDNVIEDIAARAGGTGQNGNAVNVFRAANVIVRNNMIRRCALLGGARQRSLEHPGHR